MVLPGHTVYTTACIRIHACRPVHVYAAAADAPCMPPRLQGPLSVSLSLSLSLSPFAPLCLSVACSSPVFMRVSMGKGSATRTRRKIISDLPRARRSCRPPYIARRSVLRCIFEMETHLHHLLLHLHHILHIHLLPLPFRIHRRDSVPATFVRRNSKRKKKRERENVAYARKSDVIVKVRSAGKFGRFKSRSCKNGLCK